MLFSFHKCSKIYHSLLSPDEINTIVGRKLQQRAGLFATQVFTGKVVDEGFDLFAFRKLSFFSVRISARYITGSENCNFKISYATGFNPFIIIAPLWIFFYLTTRASSYTINGDEVNKLTGIAFSFGIILLLTIIIAASAFYAVRKERLILEEELKLN